MRPHFDAGIGPMWCMRDNQRWRTFSLTPVGQHNRQQHMRQAVPDRRPMHDARIQQVLTLPGRESFIAAGSSSKERSG
jgi:hypothetical protein